MNWADFNRAFYDSFADEFSQSREAINPGILRALKSLDLSLVLDVGCGDGRVSKALPDGGRYVGLDFSAKLIGRAVRPARRGQEQAGQGRHYGGLRPALPLLALADFSSPLPIVSRSFPAVVCFAVLHHLTERAPLMRELARVVRPGGRIAISVWQITHDERMRKKIARDLGNGDYVLSWERGGHGERFVHEVTEEELWNLASLAGLEMMEAYRSDGRSGDLGLYGILTPTPTLSRSP